MRLTGFDVQEYAESPALSEYISDDALVSQGAKVPTPFLSPVEMRKSTPAGSLRHAGSASTYKAGDQISPTTSSLEFRRDD